MKKIFIVGFFLLLQHVCMASDKSNSESEFELPQKHKITLETGAVIYGYENVQDFRNEQTTKLLAARLDILCNLMKSYNQGDMSGTNYYKTCLNMNDIFLMSNAPYNDLEKIFDETYSNHDINISHIIQVATCLEEKIPEREANERKKLRDLVSRCEVLRRGRSVDVYKGESEPVSAHPQSPQSNLGLGISQGTGSTAVH
jgi:hypothetical protein